MGAKIGMEEAVLGLRVVVESYGEEYVVGG